LDSNNNFIAAPLELKTSQDWNDSLQKNGNLLHHFGRGIPVTIEIRDLIIGEKSARTLAISS
jgi:hypothetical protein